MYLGHLSIFDMAALALTVCGGAPAPPTPAAVQAFTTVCDKANDGRRVAVEDYLRFLDSFTESGSVVLRMRAVYARPGSMP